jgi:hypothetical protein
MQEAILDIQLMNRLALGCGNAKNNPNGGGLNDRTKSLIIIDLMLLSETRDHPMSLVSCKRTIRIELVVEDPFARHHINTCRSRNKSPCILIH